MRALLNALLLALFAAFLLPAPGAAQTAEEHADQWLEANRGDRDWRQRMTEQLTTGPFERLFGSAADGTMKVIVNRVLADVEAKRNGNHSLCIRAALERAFEQKLVSDRKVVMVGAAGMVWSSAGAAAGGGGLADDIVALFGRQFLGTVYSKARDQLFDQFKSTVRDELKKGLPDHFSDSDRRGPCRTFFNVVWDKAGERYTFLMAGDCGCNRVNCRPGDPQITLGRWTITGHGTVIPNIEWLPNGDKRISFDVSRPRVFDISADCCGRGKAIEPRTAVGDEWVGTVGLGAPTTPVPPPPTPAPQPPREATPGGQPPRPTRTATGTRPIPLPPVPEGPITMDQWQDAYEAAQAAEEATRARHQDATRRKAAVDGSATATDADKTAAAADEEAALEAAREATRRRLAIWDKMPRGEQNQQEQIGSDPRREGERAARTELGRVVETHTGLARHTGREQPRGEPREPAEPRGERGADVRDGRALADSALSAGAARVMRGSQPGSDAGAAAAGPGVPVGARAPQRPNRIAMLPSGPAPVVTVADVTGVFRLATPIGMLTRVTLTQAGEQLRMTGAGAPVLLARRGNSWVGSGATLDGEAGYAVTLRPLPGRVEFVAVSPAGRRIATSLLR